MFVLSLSLSLCPQACLTHAFLSLQYPSFHVPNIYFTLPLDRFHGSDEDVSVATSTDHQPSSSSDRITRTSVKALSQEWDADWGRWVHCRDPFDSSGMYMGRYTVGSLVGRWVGRMLVSLASLTVTFYTLIYFTMPITRPYRTDTHQNKLHKL